MTREQIYDEKFSPLVSQLIALAKEHDIPMLVQCQINDDRGTPDADSFYCTSVILPGDASEQMKKAAQVMKPTVHWGAFMTVAGETQQLAGSNMPPEVKR